MKTCVFCGQRFVTENTCTIIREGLVVTFIWKEIEIPFGQAFCVRPFVCFTLCFSSVIPIACYGSSNVGLLALKEEKNSGTGVLSLSLLILSRCFVKLL